MIPRQRNQHRPATSARSTNSKKDNMGQRLQHVNEMERSRFGFVVSVRCWNSIYLPCTFYVLDC
jgi:hypothetical protein